MVKTALVDAFAPQGQTVQDRPDQVRNNAGGFVYETETMNAFRRFLVLGTDGGTYYASQRSHTLQAVESMKRAFAKDPMAALAVVVDVSTRGLAPSNEQAIFALAYATTVPEIRTAAYSALGSVVRTGTHLFSFMEYAKLLGRGRGSGFNKAVSRFYTDRSIEQAAYQLMKYRQRNGWSAADVLRLTKPHPRNDNWSAVFAWAVGKPFDHEMLPANLRAAVEVMSFDLPVGDVIARMTEHNLPWEVLPTNLHNEPVVWDALIPTMPLGALVRNLRRFSKLGLTHPLSATESLLVDRITNRDNVKAARLHPIKLVDAALAYADSFIASDRIVDALDNAVMLAFDVLPPSSGRYLYGIDVSGSMNWKKCSGTSITPMQAAAVMATASLLTTPVCHTMAFTHSFQRLHLTRNWRENLHKMNRLSFGSTDCAKPMQYASREGIEVDGFVVLTDNETWAGNVKPSVALQAYRKKINPNARLVVAGMTATMFTIADPNDPDSLDIVGMSTDVPELITSFVDRRF